MEYIKILADIVQTFGMCSSPAQGKDEKMQFQINSKELKQIQNKQIDEEKVVRRICMQINYEQIGVRVPEIKKSDDKKILFLDLDQTIIYFCPKNGVLIRPFLNQFIKQLSQLYNIYIFSAASSKYINQILDVLKQKTSQIKCVVGTLSRDNCIRIRKQNKSIYVKDLRILNKCNPSDIIIVDDNPISYCLNKQNALFIQPYLGLLNDDYLKQIKKYLIQASMYRDVRDYINKLGDKSRIFKN